MKRAGINTIVSMLTEEEETELGLSEEKNATEALGLKFYSYPIPDRSTPSDLIGFKEFVSVLRADIGAGRSVGVHCRGCIGRATITTASVLIASGWMAGHALAEIEAARGCSIPDTSEQRRWIETFRPGSS